MIFSIFSELHSESFSRKKMKLYIQRGDLDALKVLIVAKEHSLSDLEVVTLSNGEFICIYLVLSVKAKIVLSNQMTEVPSFLPVLSMER